jgi:hypothetical protein
MESIQVKTVDPISQDLLKSAYQRGLKLVWDRFEKLQPQDGFLRIGLSCPYGCLQGPCRIDPFGRGPERGLCGLDRDGMVAALLLRLSLSGALEAMPAPGKEPSWDPALKDALSRVSKKLGGEPISSRGIQTAASLLMRPMESAEGLIAQSLRLALLTIGWLCKGAMLPTAKKPLPLAVGYGLLAQKDYNVGICGQPSPEDSKAVLAEINSGFGGKGQLVSLGEFIALEGRYLPCICTSGEAELILSSGKIHLLIAGPGADASVSELCRTLNIPCASSTEPKAVRALVAKAKKGQGPPVQTPFNPSPSLVEEAETVGSASLWEESLKKAGGKKLALLGGSDHPYHSLGWVPTEVAPALQAKGFAVSTWGDSALWMVKKGLASKKMQSPVQVLGGQQGSVLALKALAASARLKDVKGIFYTGVKSCQDLAVALGLAVLGLRVGMAVPLPLWGSEKVRNLLQERLAAMGGSLIHFDHPAQAEEILDWFLKN